MEIDKKFGPKTKQTLIAFQNKNGLPPTGIFTWKEAEALGEGFFTPAQMKLLYSPGFKGIGATFRERPLPTKSTIDPGQQNPGDNEDRLPHYPASPLAARSSKVNTRNPQLVSRPQYSHPENG